MLNGVEGKKAEEIIYENFKNILKIRKFIYSIFFILINESNDSENQINKNSNINPSKDEKDIPLKYKILINWEKLKFFLRQLNSNLEAIDKNDFFFNNIDFYKNIFYNNSNIKFDPLNILFYLNYKSTFRPETRLKLLSILNQIIYESKQQVTIFEYINNNITEQQLMKKDNKISIKNFANEVTQAESISSIIIELFLFNIYIKLPNKENLKISDFPNQTIVLVKFNYEHPISPLEILNKSNKTYILKNLENQRKKRKFFLTEKLSKLFLDRIFSIIKKIFKEKKNKGERKDAFLKEICNKFLDYIYDYDNLFKIKCRACNKIVKYSLQEKCFYPPYYKIYEEIDNNDKANKIGNKSLFYHEECFRKNFQSNPL